MELFTRKRQSVAHVRVFGSKCWAKIPTVHGAQVTGGSKLDPRSIECRFLGYTSGAGNYKVQDVTTCRIYTSHDVIFEEGRPHRTLTSVGENQIFEADTFETDTPTSLVNNINNDPDPAIIEDHHGDTNPDQIVIDQVDQQRTPVIPAEPRQSARAPQPSKAGLHSMEYQNCEKEKGQDWATNGNRPKASIAIDCSEDHENIIVCLTETKASHHIPRSYKHTMATDPERWMIPMQVEMDTLKTKHTWDLVRPPPGANIMDLMWVYDIKWRRKVD